MSQETSIEWTQTVRDALALGTEVGEALSRAYCCDCRAISQLDTEVGHGCWDGVRALIESYAEARAAAIKSLARAFPREFPEVTRG